MDTIKQAYVTGESVISCIGCTGGGQHLCPRGIPVKRKPQYSFSQQHLQVEISALV